MRIRKNMVSILSACLLASAAISPAAAQDRQFSAKAGEQVNAALTLANDGQTQAAVTRLEAAITAPDLTAYERSTIYQMMGQYFYDLDRPKDAQHAFENAVDAGGLLPKEADNINITITQLMIGNGQYRAGAQRLEAHLNAGGEVKPEYIELLVNGWVQAEVYSRALPWAEKWFDAASPKMRKHFDLLNFLYSQTGQAERQADVVKQMIDRWPEDKALWTIWASMLANGGREQEAFEVKKIMYLKGFIATEPELLKVVQYYSFYDMPYQAAKILEQEMADNRISRTPETLTQLSNLHRQAREYGRAIPVLDAAAKLSGDAATYAALGEALYNEGDCVKSEVAFNEAITRGYDAGKSWMLIASCRYDQIAELDRLTCDMSDAQMAQAPITKARGVAIEAFGRVPTSSGVKADAQKWVQFISAEKDAFDRRCGLIIDVEKDLCFQKIKQAYDAIFITGELRLEDDACWKYKDEYDAKYRQAAPPE